jgi:hypothetical protein
MLPGFRFLFGAIVFSLSILVFGLGAAALLRAAHEEVASNPSWRAAPETMFAQRAEASPPMLAMLRVEPAAPAQKPDNVPAASAPGEPAAVVAAPPEQATVAAPAEPERMAALSPETLKPETPAAEDPAPAEAAPAQADQPAAAEQTRIAATEPGLPPPNEAVPAAAVPAASKQTGAPALPVTDIAATKIATLGGPAVTIEPAPPADAASAKADRDVIKKRQQARRAAQRRKLAARARLAQQPPTDPFGQTPSAQPVTPVRAH